MKSEQLKVLIRNDAIQQRITEMAEEISNDYKGKDIEIICVLRGAVIFTVELCMQITENTRFNFIEVSSYEGTESTGKIKINKDITDSITGKDVLIVEDIIDTGRTLSYLRDYLLEKKPNSLKICTLVNKPARREVEIPIDYNGFTIEDKFIIGHGFDIDNDYRNKKDILYVEQKKKTKN